jgi:hypothetical protein
MTRSDRMMAVVLMVVALAGLGSLGYCAVWGARDLRCAGVLR